MNSSALGWGALGDVDKVWHLRQATLLSGLSQRDLDAVVAICSDHVHAKGEVVFYQNDPAGPGENHQRLEARRCFW